jgi:hypothetical protein
MALPVTGPHGLCFHATVKLQSNVHVMSLLCHVAVVSCRCCVMLLLCHVAVVSCRCCVMSLLCHVAVVSVADRQAKSQCSPVSSAALQAVPVSCHTLNSLDLNPCIFSKRLLHALVREREVSANTV